MADKTSKSIRAALGGVAAVCMAIVAMVPPVAAQTQRTVLGQEYIPTVWVDPDGCEHWVMDDGAEGYMTPHVNRNGIPVCRRGSVCGVMNSDQFFATDKYYINAANRQSLAQFFQNSTASAFIIAGHTDSRASDSYNMRLSHNRANAVAQVARQSGARVVDVRGYGERVPRASNRTASGMAQNRRVEIICLR
ncbi:OmpA family protein [Shimia abyssi]|uniref:OmpA family protein n=2 Tax=Shimia abyssi TaxID=1662395 RepID=A0A2P8FDJ8_9RHOB|nr:OmpA family protein [Shimia abyssi]